MNRIVFAAVAMMLVLSAPVLADENVSSGWLPLAKLEANAPAAPAPTKGPPIPFHSIEGYSGGPITPMAYLCNPGPKGSFYSKPSAAYTFLNLGSKKLHVFSVTQVFFNRLELGYAYNNLNLGSMYDDLKKASLNMGRDHVNLHHFNVRFNLLPENSFDLPLPAVTAGVHFKYNEGIKNIDKSLGGAFKGIGYDKNHGVDYTLTATKMFPELALGRPIILTGGLRFSNASQLGFFGFGGEHNLTFEGSVACLPVDNIALAYEFREKNNPYGKIPNLVDEEHNWHAFSVSWIANDRLTITAVYGMFGNIGNARADSSVGVQLKYEF